MDRGGYRNPGGGVDINETDTSHASTEYFRPLSPFDSPDSADQEIPVTYEEPWNSTIEKLLYTWKDDATRQSQDHCRAGYRLKFKYGLLNFIVILWASINLVSSNFFECNNQTVSKLLSLVINSIQVFLSGLNSSMNLGYAYRLQFEYEAKFKALAVDIEYQLVRDRDFRMPADAFMTEVRERTKRLTDAPEIPKGWLFFC